MLPYVTALFIFKVVNFFLGKKCIRATWLEDFLTSK